MFEKTKAFSGFSVKDMAAAKKFYGQTLGMEVEDGPMGLQIKVAGGNPIFVYQKDDHEPAVFTILNFPVDDIDKAVDELVEKGVKMERYDGFEQDDKGIARGRQANMGPDIAWFTDPAGNILSVLQD